MSKTNSAIQKFNNGIISPLALARTDVKRVALSAATQTNWMCRTLGSMMLRPGTRFIYEATTGNNPVRYLPFVFNNSDTALIEMSYQQMRVLVNEAIITRVSVGTAITNGTFAGNITGWTNNDDAGCTSAYAATDTMSLIGTNFNHAKEYQEVTVVSGDQNKEHGLHIIISRGVIDLLVGTSQGDSSYILVKNLSEGEYSFAFTPTGNFYVQVQSSTQYATLISSIVIESAGAMIISTPFQSTDLPNFRYDISADVIFMATSGYQQYKIERFATRSWALVKYYANDGPFELENIDQSIQLTPSAILGDITLTASSAFFQSGMVGQLFRIASQGQFVTVTLTAVNQFSGAVEVTGVGVTRNLTINITGTWSANIVLQQSIGSPGAWVTVATYTSNESALVYNDSDDNSIIYYRIGIASTGYTSGTAVATLTFAGGTINGICRIDAYSSSTSVSAYVLQDFGGTTASINWWQGTWSSINGYPTAVQLYQGRLWFAGHDSIDGSVSGAFASFDDTVVGDSGPIDLTIGSGPVDVINWILGGLLLLVGGQAGEHSLSAGYLGTPITPTAFVIRNPSTFGSTNVQMEKIDWNAVFVKKDGVRVCMSSIENSVYAFDYKTEDLTLLTPEIGVPGIVKIAIQRIPDTRIHCIRADGKVAVNVYDISEEVKGWVIVDLGSNAWVEDALVMPPLPISTIDPNGVYNNTNGYTTLVPEDTVYYLVRRVINGTTVRYFERWSLEYECQGGTLSKQIDCHTVVQNGSPSTALSLPQLADQTVVVWGDGIYQGTYTADGSGNITLGTAVTNVVAGIPYTGQYLSSKLIVPTKDGSALTQVKRIEHLGVIMLNTHQLGLQYGKDFTSLDGLPSVVDGATVEPNTIWATYDKKPFVFPGKWDTDSRLALQAQSPFPVTLLGVVLSVETDERS